MNTMIESGDWDFNEDIEKFWRERFADQIEFALMHQIPDFDTETEWFNKGMRHAALRKMVRELSPKTTRANRIANCMHA